MKALRLTLWAALALAAPAAASAAPVLRVDVDKPVAIAPAYAGGVNQVFSTSTGGVPGNWDAAADRPVASVVDQTRAAGVGLIRFPGGAEAARYDWKAAIGPDRAGCQYSGRGVQAPALSDVYGFDEHMRFVEAAGAEAEVTIPFAFSGVQSAADWVEYANAPFDGSNPGGGVDWAAVRALGGHPEPYGVTRWDIGDDPARNSQRYWMSPNARQARAEYAAGGVHRAFNESADADCRWATKASGLAGQAFRTRYAPVLAAGFELTVGDEVWTRVSDLTTATPDAKVYTLDETTGAIAFGDGLHGRVPPGGARVAVTYRTARLPGYEQFRAAMKAVDPTIDVCAAWADTAFLRAAARAKRPIDCLTAHAYTDLADYGSVLYDAAHYDAAMKGAAQASERVARLVDAAREAPGQPYVAVSDYGALAGGSRLEPGASGSMIHAMYMATAQMRWLRLGLPWATGGRLTDSPFAIVNAARDGLTPAGDMLLPAAALAKTQLVHASVTGNPRNHGYTSLRVLAARAPDGRLVLLLLNRDRDRPRDVRLSLAGFAGSGQAEQAQTTSAAFDSALAAYDVSPVTAKNGTVVRLPAHSLTRLTLDPG